MSVNEVNFNVQMSCGGCSNAVKKILTKIEGDSTIIYTIEITSIRIKV